MNEKIHAGLMKAVAYAETFKQHDAQWERDERTTSEILPRVFVRAMLTAFTLQLCSLFEEGLEDYLAARHGEEALHSLARRVQFLKSKGELSGAAGVEELVALRNRLAHDSDAFATWDDWYAVYRTVKRELGHLGVVPERRV